MAQVTVVARNFAKPGQEDEVKKALMNLVKETTAKDKGCLNYTLHQSPDDPKLFLFYENWADEESFKGHASSAHIKAWREKSKELLERPVEISFWRVMKG